MKNPPIKKTQERLQPVFSGSPLANARQIVVLKNNFFSRLGKPVIAIDADCLEYKFRSVAEVERTIRISSDRISAAINDYKAGKRIAPLVEGFCWCYEVDVEEHLPKIKTWITLNSKPNPNTHI